MNNTFNRFTKKIVFGLFVLSLVGVLVGYLLTSSYDFGFCYSNIQTNTFDVSCHGFYEGIGNPLFYGMSALALVFFILIFTRQAFSAWKKFAIWFIPLATLLFIFYPDYSSHDYFSPDPSQIFRWISILYVIISILIIILKMIRQRSENSRIS